MPKKEASQIIVLSWSPVSSNTLTTSNPVNLSFVPDEAIIRSLSFIFDNNGHYQLSTDMFNNSQPFLSFISFVNTNPDSIVVNRNLEIPIIMYDNEIQGKYNFYLTNIGSSVNFTGDLSLVIEFVKYKKYKK